MAEKKVAPERALSLTDLKFTMTGIEFSGADVARLLAFAKYRGSVREATDNEQTATIENVARALSDLSTMGGDQHVSPDTLMLLSSVLDDACARMNLWDASDPGATAQFLKYSPVTVTVMPGAAK